MSPESILAGSIRRSKLLQQKQLFLFTWSFSSESLSRWFRTAIFYYQLPVKAQNIFFQNISYESGNIYNNRRRFWFTNNLFLKELNCYSYLQILLVFFMIDHLPFLSFRQSHDYLFYTYFFLLMQSFHMMRVVEFAVTCQHYQIFRL